MVVVVGKSAFLLNASSPQSPAFFQQVVGSPVLQKVHYSEWLAITDEHKSVCVYLSHL